MKPGGQRNKGHAFERKVANDLKAIFPNAKRGFQTRGGGKEQCDVEGTPYHIECKHCARVDVRKAYTQAATDAHESEGDYRPPFVVHKQNRGPIEVSSALTVWLEYLVGTTAWPFLKSQFGGSQMNPLVTMSYEAWLELLKRKHG